ncbi:hypothetical protein [Paraoerskovia marina]|uniref:hypothetical protein n=1 Tax=Paraoerskovia marina TaxID=545619 RepID=UPI00049231AD|nr:hypothetical protein [Paraoerskovia marina]
MSTQSVAAGSPAVAVGTVGPRWAWRAFALLVTAVLAVAWAASPAHAHGGDLQVDIGTDGAGGIDAAVSWAADGHPVEETVDLIVTAVSDDGTEVGPVQLQSASEGVGWYKSEPGLLGEGHWVLTSVATVPAEYSGTTEIDVAPVVTPEPDEPAPGPETELAADTSDSAATGETGSGTSWGWVAVGVAAVVAFLAVGAVVLLRRRTNE